MVYGLECRVRFPTETVITHYSRQHVQSDFAPQSFSFPMVKDSISLRGTRQDHEAGHSSHLNAKLKNTRNDLNNISVTWHTL
jgi:hypothetical protein